MKTKKMTIKDVAKQAGVGVGSVSRVINQFPGVKEETRIQVEKSIAKLGYKPDNLARSLRTQKTQTIAFFVNDISNIAFSTIAKGIQQELEPSGFHLLLYNTGNERVKEQIVEAFRNRKFDGMVLSFPDEQDSSFIKEIENSDIPFILLDREIQGIRADTVYSDFYSGIRQAVEYLISLAHTRIGFITSRKEIRPSRESLRGYSDAMKLNGLPVNTEWIKRGFFSVEYGRQAFDELMEEKVTAVIAGSNQLLVGCVEGIRANRIQVPAQLSIIGFEDSDFTRLMAPAITVVKRPLIQIGKQIAYLMLKRLKPENTDSESVSSVIPTELVKRESCAPPLNRS